jgi:DNA-binding PadR family transcriptional regulator
MGKELSPQWVLLGLLTRKPMHGYEVHQFFTAPSPLEKVWHLGISQMYKLLKDLESQGHVDVSIEPQDSRPDKKVYHVTPSGRQAFLDWLQTPISGIRLIRVEFLGKLFLAQSLGPEMVERVTDVQRAACRALLAELREEQPTDGFEALVLRFRTGQTEAAIDWLEYCRTALAGAWSQDD